MTPTMIAIALALLAIATGLVYREGSKAPDLTKRDFYWLGWKPTHLHYKGGLYEEATRAIVTDDVKAGETVVVYVHQSGSTYARRAEMFDEQTRFRSIET